jgi:predicted secreted protein
MAIRSIRGRDFILYFNKGGVYTPACYCTDFTLTRTRDTLEITGPQGQDRDYIPTFKGYTIQFDAVVSYYDGFSYVDVIEAFDNGDKLAWKGSDQNLAGVVHSGVVILTNDSWASPVRGEFTASTVGIGCGPKTTEYIDIVTNVYLADANKVRLFGCPNPYPVSVFWYTNDGNNIGTFIGVANNADEVVDWYNNYSENLYWTLSLGETGCDFVLSSDWNAPYIPDVVFAQAAPDLGLSPDLDNNEGLSPDLDNDQLTSPYYA